MQHELILPYNPSFNQFRFEHFENLKMENTSSSNSMPSDICNDVNEWIQTRILQSKDIWQNSNKIKTDNSDFENFDLNQLDLMADRLLRILTHKQFNYQSKRAIREILQSEKSKITSKLKRKEPLKFVYLYNGGYRASISSELGDFVFYPDHTESMLIYQISLLQDSVSAVYPPGIEFVIVVNNGVAFLVNDISLESTLKYVDGLREQIRAQGASSRIRVLVQSELPEFDESVRLFNDVKNQQLGVLGDLELEQHRIIERFLGRSCTANEALIRLKMYDLAENKWAEVLQTKFREEAIIFFRQVKHPNMLSFRPFPAGASRSQNGVLGFQYLSGKLTPKLITSEALKLHTIIPVAIKPGIELYEQTT